MKVIFLTNIKGVAQIGDIKEVADGYARNFLLPGKLAQPATAKAVKLAETLKIKRETELAKQKERGLALAEKLANLKLEIKKEANEQGHFYGSVSAKDVVWALTQQGVNEILPEQINLPVNLKKIGEYEIEIEFHPEVKSKLKVGLIKLRTQP